LPSPSKDSHKEGYFSEEDMNKNIKKNKKLTGGNFKPTAWGSKIQGDEDDVTGLPDVLFQEQAD